MTPAAGFLRGRGLSALSAFPVTTVFPSLIPAKLPDRSPSAPPEGAKPFKAAVLRPHVASPARSPWGETFRARPQLPRHPETAPCSGPPVLSRDGPWCAPLESLDVS